MYDLIIIGGGVAGLSAGLFAGRNLLKTLILESKVPGGQIASTSVVENYPGSIENPQGMDFAGRFEAQAAQFCEIKAERVIDVNLEGEVKQVKTSSNTYESKAIIVATGIDNKTAGIKGEDEFANRGVSYCATCDGAFYSGLDVFVVGGGESALDEGFFLTKFANKVTVVNKNEKFDAAKILVKKCQDNDKMQLLTNCQIQEIKGDEEVNEVILKDLKTGNETDIKANEDDDALGVFIFVGNYPQTKIFDGKLKMKNGYILTSEDMKTNIDGVYAVGACREKAYRQLISDANDGYIAATSVYKFLS